MYRPKLFLQNGECTHKDKNSLIWKTEIRVRKSYSI